ncbi:MAG TPA: aminodeoxychorismate/anthranilate synthase component II [Vicinamibacterales bacterium]|jgi:anthranilate synthase/aminodeoxychorismate synthase-like glutamine amidotransferase|nr:aminodeoxychorismate/anthranilate synthase component II [Vicinamibacterales bacterium]
MIFVLDNYDSFTYNLVQYLGELGATLLVRRNDQITLDEIAGLAPSHIVISPGPGRPEDAGVTPSMIERFGPSVPILGVCLGHQAIGLVCGGRVVRAPVPMHGKTSVIEHDGRGVFTGLASPIEASRYHSLIVEEQGLPDVLEVSARSRSDGIIMGLRHKTWPLQGVQFHPESVLTSEGRRMLRNFLDGR